MINNFLNWLYFTPSKWSETTNIDIANEIFELLMKWMNTTDIKLIIPEEDLIIHFYNFLYNLSINKSLSYDVNIIDNQYFFFKYHEDLVDLFMEIKEIYNIQGSSLFNKKNITTDNLLQFLNNYIEILDEIYEDDTIDNYLEDENLF